MFTISGAPSLTEVEAAMEVLKRYSVAREADEAGSLAAAAPTEFIEPTSAPSLVAPALVAPEQPEQEDQANAIGGEIPGPLAPVPLRDLGISVTAATTNAGALGGDAIAVRGAYDSTDTADIVVGYLGVGVSDTTGGEFDGFAALKALDADEMGVLGFNSNNSSDNWGVVGVSVGGGGAGRFYNTNAAGTTTTNSVLLGTTAFAVDATGPVRWDCPADMDRAGTWCIDKVANASTDGGNSITVCHNEGKTLCPLQAIMTCDQLNIRNGVTNSCGFRTDTAGALTRTFGIDNDPTGGTSAFNEFVTYAATGNALSADLNATTRSYFCCRPVSP